MSSSASSIVHTLDRPAPLPAELRALVNVLRGLCIELADLLGRHACDAHPGYFVHDCL